MLFVTYTYAYIRILINIIYSPQPQAAAPILIILYRGLYARYTNITPIECLAKIRIQNKRFNDVAH